MLELHRVWGGGWLAWLGRVGRLIRGIYVLSLYPAFPPGGNLTIVLCGWLGRERRIGSYSPKELP